MPDPANALRLAIIDFLLGGVSVAVSKLATAPFERTKLLLQTQDELIKQGRLTRRYSNGLDCLNRIIHEEGFFSLWRGVTPALIRYYPTQMLNFAIKDKMIKVFGRYDPKKDGYWKWFLSNLAAGAAAGALSLVIVYPLDYIQTRLACDVKVKGRYQFDGVLDVIKQTMNGEQGFIGSYSGFLWTVVGLVAYRAIYFGMYDLIRAFFHPKDETQKFFFGWGVGLTAALLTYPVDTIRRRLMMRGDREGSGNIETPKEILESEGAMSLMSGTLENLIRSIAGALALHICDEISMRIFGGRSN